MTPRRLLLLLAFLPLACAPAGPDLRRAETPIASSTAFDPARFVDVWHVVAAYGQEARCGKLTETWTATASGRWQVTGTRCGPAGARAFLAEARLIGPGRIERRIGRTREELWVLWVDADYRIAAIGSPSGAFGRVLARRPDPRADLMAGARAALRFNGYDPAALHPL